MIGKQYKAHKDNVIDLFERYKIKKGDLYDGVDIKFLESRVKSLKNSKFTLVVAGEVKAGKSTFINALLGTEILPSDVLQASSAIVEIFKSEASFLKVKYADGKGEVVNGDLDACDMDKASVRLREICKINEEYRQIPTTLIDDYIIASDGVLTVDDVLVKDLEQKSGEHLADKYGLIEKYISERTKEKIPLEIEFGYPLKWAFDELRIVDSPGVNATGGVQDVSFRYFEEANAILFVHPIKPIESESFRKFVNSVISDRSKETLFLILTHAGLYSNDEVERLHAEAGRLYKNVMEANRILVVDSLLKLIHCDLENGISVGDIRKSENKRKILSSYREQAEDENRELIDVVSESSRFAKMFAVIDEFSMKAPILQLQEILEKIKTGYEEQEMQCVEKIERLQQKKRNPQEFEEEITRIYNALEKCRLRINNVEEDLKSNYSGKHSEWYKNIGALKNKYSEFITGSSSIETARKNFTDALNAIQGLIDQFSRELTLRLETAFAEIGKTFKEEHQISIPVIDLASLEENAKKSAFKEEDEYEVYYEKHWYTLWLINHKERRYVGKRTVFDDDKFLGDYKTKCNEEFYKITNGLPGKFSEVSGIYLHRVSEEMKSVLRDRQEIIKKEKDKKQSNEEIISEIKDLSGKKNDIQLEKSLCVEILEDIR